MVGIVIFFGDRSVVEMYVRLIALGLAVGYFVGQVFVAFERKSDLLVILLTMLVVSILFLVFGLYTLLSIWVGMALGIG